MYAIKMPNGNYLDGEFAFQFELNNQIFSDGDVSALSGSFSFPTEVPMSGKNKVELGNPHLVNNANAWKTFPGVWIEVYNVPLFYGTLQIKRANASTASIAVIASAVFDIKDLKLKDIDLGGPRVVSDWQELMQSTADVPEDNDFAFFPVWNPEHNSYPDTDPHYADRSWQNYYSTTTNNFSLNSGAITPFVKLEYLLQAIFKATSFELVNEWQTSIELRRLYVYNNFDAREIFGTLPSMAPDLPDNIYLKNHVPDITCRDLLRKTIAHFCLGLFTNPFTGKVNLVPVQTLLKRPAVHDWTNHLVSKLQIEEAQSTIRAYDYPQPVEISPTVTRPHNAIQVRTLADLNAAIAAQPDGTTKWYYAEDGHALVQITKISGGFTYVPYMQHQGVYPYGDAESPFETGVESLRSLYTPTVGYGYYAAFTQSSVWRDNGAWERDIQPGTFAFMFYRGIQDDGDGDVPLATNHVWLPSGIGGTRSDITTDGAVVATAQHSLNWFGEYGLYAQYHQLWGELINKNKPVTLSLALPVATVTAYSMADKVRIESMDYIVRRMRIGRALGNGLLLVEATMVSVI
jgi:hypothetical protein